MEITYCPKCGAKLYSTTAGYYCSNLVCLLHIRPNGEWDENPWWYYMPPEDYYRTYYEVDEKSKECSSVDVKEESYE